MNNLILSYEFPTPGIMVAQTDIKFAQSLIEDVRLEEAERNYKVVHHNENVDWHKEAGKSYHITFIDKTAPALLNYDNDIALLVTQCLDIYNSQFHDDGLNVDQGYNVLHYLKGGDYPWHYDGVANNIEAFFLLNLNDDFEGGVLEFSQFDFNIPAKAGQVIIGPTGLAFEHRSTKITSGEKFIVRSRLAKRQI